MSYRLASFILVIFCFVSVLPSTAQEELQARIDAHILPLVETNNFSGQVLAARQGQILFQKNYGLSDRTNMVPIDDDTRFQIASVSKSLTAAAVVRLISEGHFTSESPVSTLIEGYPAGDKITVHHLLTHTSGIPNVNRFDVYAQMDQVAQTPSSLIEYFKNEPLEFEPGTQYRYSNSNYNVLALIIENVSGMTYGDYLQKSFFTPIGMNNTAHPSARQEWDARHALGYAPEGITGAAAARSINWTVKTGNGSLFSTANDLYRWAQACFKGSFFSDEERKMLFTEHEDNVGYGWFIRPRHNRHQIHINGRSPGFSSVVSCYPDDDIFIVVVSNNYVPIATQLSIDIAAMLFDEDYRPFIAGNGKISEREATVLKGEYQFGPDFFQPDKILTVRHEEGYLVIDWGVLFNRGDGTFINRDYWMDVFFDTNEEGKQFMDYGGYRGSRLGEE